MQFCECWDVRIFLVFRQQCAAVQIRQTGKSRLLFCEVCQIAFFALDSAVFLFFQIGSTDSPGPSTLSLKLNHASVTVWQFHGIILLVVVVATSQRKNGYKKDSQRKSVRLRWLSEGDTICYGCGLHHPPGV